MNQFIIYPLVNNASLNDSKSFAEASTESKHEDLVSYDSYFGAEED